MIRWILVCFSFYFTLCLTAQVPNTQFTVSQQNALVGSSISFTNQSTGASNYQWTFADGSAIETIANPLKFQALVTL